MVKECCEGSKYNQKDCCDGEAAINNAVVKKTKEPVKNTRYTHFSSLSASEQQSFADFQEKERRRHLDDVAQIEADLKVMKDRYQIEPRLVYVGAWLEVK